MKRTKILLGGLAMALLLAACSGGGYKKSKSGLLYKVISEGKGKPAERGQILKFHVAQRLKGTSSDSLLFESFGKMPNYWKVDSVGTIYHPMEILPLLRKGDSAVVILSADSLMARNPGQIPPFIKKKDKLIVSFKVIDIFTSDSAAQADNQIEGGKEQARAMAEQQKLTDEGTKLRGPAVKEIEDYLAKNKINAQKTKNGTYVEIKDPGTGAQADSGKKLLVKYTGKTFATGKEFESNMDGSRPPLEVLLGTGGVIRGWDEGLAFFKKGGKGTLYVPFFEAYGDRPGPDGKPHASLIFDVEIVDVLDANAPQAQAPPPPPPAEGQPKRK